MNDFLVNEREKPIVFAQLNSSDGCCSVARDQGIAMGARFSNYFSGETTQLAEAGLKFGHSRFAASLVSFSSPHAAAFSARPIAEGHAIVATRRCVARTAELSSAEYLDLWRTVGAVCDAAEMARGATASNLLLRDGAACGPAVAHLHVHVVPRLPGDFVPNDEVFSALEVWAPSDADAASRPSVRGVLQRVWPRGVDP